MEKTQKMVEVRMVSIERTVAVTARRVSPETSWDCQKRLGTIGDDVLKLMKDNPEKREISVFEFQVSFDK